MEYEGCIEEISLFHALRNIPQNVFGNKITTKL